MNNSLTSVTASAPGKTNLFFAVGPLLPDGFHEVASVYLALDLRDEVTVIRSDNWSVSTSGTVSNLQLDAVPTGEDNLVVKAAKFVAELADHPAEPLAFQIDKHVPVAGGMGGGSADAAAALMAVNALWATEVDSELQESVSLGADVPFALAGGLAVGLGRGEKLTQLESAAKFHLVLVTSDLGLSTPAVYRRLDEIRVARGEDPTQTPEAEVPASVIRALQTGELSELSKVLKNDLQEAALDLRPDLKITLDAGLASGARMGFVSGSGPTVAFLTDDQDGAEALAQKLLAQGFSAVSASGPAPGTFIREEI